MVNNVFIFLLSPAQPFDEDEALLEQHLQLLLAKKPKKGASADDFLRCLGLCSEKSRLLLADLVAFFLFDVQARLRFAGSESAPAQKYRVSARCKLVDALDKEQRTNRANLVHVLEVNLVGC